MHSKILAKKVYTENSVLENQLIVAKEGIIKDICSSKLTNDIQVVEHLSAGFLDIQVNGGESYHFTAKPDRACLNDIDMACIGTGTAYVLPTMITSSLENILKGIEAVQHYQNENPSSSILGMHLEGPFMNPVKRGAHLSKYIQKPTSTVVKEILKHGEGVILQMTLAPEMFDEVNLRLLIDSPIAIAAGHSNATYEEAIHAFDMGIQQVTHLYNAMSPLKHRAPGLVGATFDRPTVYAPLVLDGAHCDFAAARIAHKIKKDKLFLISDALFLGRKKKTFTWEEFDARLTADAYVNSDGNLAGASISIGDAVRNAVSKLKLDVKEAIAMATIRPARAIGLANKLGKVEVGYPAKFTVFDDGLKNFNVLSLE